jgi:hypothetical protein
MFDSEAGRRDYMPQVKKLNAGLSDAKVAVYPINISGVRAMHIYEAETVPPNTPDPALYLADAARREVQMRGFEQETMITVAEGTGGKVCDGNNDLADCVHMAVDDSSNFYEIAYYPDSPNWNGAYHKILLKAPLRAAHLAYRQGYFAIPAERDDVKLQASEMQANCDDTLDATAVPFRAKRLPPDSPDQLKFGLLIDASALTLTGTADNREIDVSVAVCTLTRKGRPIKLMSYPIRRLLRPGQTAALDAGGGVTESIFVPGPKPFAVRVLVKDVATGRLGSVYIETNSPN